MNVDQFWQEMNRIIDKKIDDALKDLRHFADYGIVVAVSSTTVDLKINGSDEVTKSVPFRSDMALAIGNKVTILNLNFNRNERLIIDKRT